MQGELFELTVANLKRTDGTARLRWTCIASDRLKYAIKRVNDAPWLPATEWFCHRLAEAVHLPTPVYRILRLLEDDSLAFGSRWESGARQYADLAPADRARYYTSGINVCRIIGLDLFLPNGDRNLGNFLWHWVDGQPTALAFDFSEAWAMHGDLASPPPLDGECRTLKVMDWLRQMGGLRQHDIGEIIRRLQTLKPAVIDAIAESIPDEWLPDGGRDAIMQWWSSPSTVTRLTMLAIQYPCPTPTTTPSSA